nr:hypothetical protein [Tanacetum cinerariifolium]
MNDKSKDTVKARQDLQRLGIRSGLWLGQSKNGKCLKPQAAYSLTLENQKSFVSSSKELNYQMGSNHASSTKCQQMLPGPTAVTVEVRIAPSTPCKGKRKPNLGARAAGRLNTRDKTRNLSLKEITDTKGPVPIQFELRDKQTVMPLVTMRLIGLATSGRSLGMSADVARSHGGDGRGEDRPPPHHVPSGCMGCFANRGKGKR